MFELLGGRDDHAETAYLAGVQSSDIYVGVLGARYGTPDRTGYAPTHAEYNEAIKAGLRISVWATTAEMDGRQRDFLNEIRAFHTTGRYASPDELHEALKRRLTEVAAAEHSPWCKVGHVLFRARRYSDDGTPNHRRSLYPRRRHRRRTGTPAPRRPGMADRSHASPARAAPTLSRSTPSSWKQQQAARG